MKNEFKILLNFIRTAFCLSVFLNIVNAQETVTKSKDKQIAPPISKKVNQRPTVKTLKTSLKMNLFEKATVESMGQQCVKFETSTGNIELEVFPESAPETVRAFLNLAASGALDTTSFNRVVAGFIVQGGDLATREKMTPEYAKRAGQTILDEPNLIKHERGILSMARAETPNSATTNFFILIGKASHLDGTFAAFGRVTRGMETVDAINKMPLEGEKPVKPVRLNRATVAICSSLTVP